MLCVRDLKIHFHDAAPDRFAVNGISFDMPDGEILGLVGESGSGKTVTAMAVSGLLPRRKSSVSGSILLDGQEILTSSRDDMRSIQGKSLTVVFQEPMTSLDPVMKIGPQVEESLRLHTDLSPEQRRERALNAMAKAELPDPQLVYNKYPHELSGGMLQRVMIAAAIISRPSLLLADEPTTALDVTIQAQILQLLRKINEEDGTSILFISHNLNVVRKLCKRVIVMEKGLIVESGSTEDIFRAPQHPYTRHLIDCIPGRNRRLR